MTAILDVPLEDYLALHAERDKLKEEKKRLVEALKNITDKSSLRNGGPFYLYDEYGYGQKIYDQARALLSELSE